jgi:hypothetical protein
MMAGLRLAIPPGFPSGGKAPRGITVEDITAIVNERQQAVHSSGFGGPPI